jgi:O-antigen/teichoic acid export membrane protein
LAKTIVLIVHFKKYFTRLSSKPNLLILKKGFPFMMLGLSGVMLQKTDMITVAYFLTKYEIAQYQVFCSFLLFMQAFPGLITAPYAKNIYRISSSSYTKIQMRFVLIGLSVTSIFIAITYFSMMWIYAFNFSWMFYLLGFLYGSLTYFYSIRIYILYKKNGQNTVMWISAAGIVFNFMMCCILIPKFNIMGAVLGNVLTQLFLVLAYQFTKIDVSSTQMKHEYDL